MRSERALPSCGAGLALILAASEIHAASDCDSARAVSLDIVAGASPAGADVLEQAVIAELDTNQIAVCAAPPRALTLPRVQIRATRPDWQRASIRLEAAHASSIERDLDVSKLPPEARALAIASATDELIRSALDASAAPAASAPGPGATAAPAAPAGLPSEIEGQAPSASRAPPELPVFDLGLGVGGSSYTGQRQAIENDLLVRYWLPSGPELTARLGLAQRLSRPPERGAVQPDSDLHAALGAGLTIWGEPRRLALLGEAAVQLSRVGFDERRALATSEPDERATDGAPALGDDFLAPIEPDSVDTPRPAPRSAEGTNALDRAWALAASLGIEARAQRGPMGLSLALAALVPLLPARSAQGDQTTLDALGVQLRFGAWVVLGSRPAPSER